MAVLGEHGEGAVVPATQITKLYPGALPRNGYRRLNLVGVEVRLSQSALQCVGCIASCVCDEASCHGNHHGISPPLPTNPDLLCL